MKIFVSPTRKPSLNKVTIAKLTHDGSRSSKDNKSFTMTTIWW